MPAPAYEAVEYKTVRFNGTLDFPSPYSGPPSPAVDAAWDRITTNNSCECSYCPFGSLAVFNNALTLVRPIRVADRVLDKIYKSGRASNVQYHEEDGGESMGTIEVFHQLHCLVRISYSAQVLYELIRVDLEHASQIYIPGLLSRTSGPLEH